MAFASAATNITVVPKPLLSSSSSSSPKIAIPKLPLLSIPKKLGIYAAAALSSESPPPPPPLPRFVQSPAAKSLQLDQIVRLISESQRPLLYVGGECWACEDELHKFVTLTGIPLASTVVGLATTMLGLGCYPPTDDELSIRMLDKSDLLLAFGVSFDDGVAAKLEAFAPRAKMVHISIDADEIWEKNTQPRVSICAHIKPSLRELNKILEAEDGLVFDFSGWRDELDQKRREYPLMMSFNPSEGEMMQFRHWMSLRMPRL